MGLQIPQRSNMLGPPSSPVLKLVYEGQGTAHMGVARTYGRSAHNLTLTNTLLSSIVSFELELSH